VRKERIVMARGLKVGTNGGSMIVDLSAQRLVEPKDLAGTIMVVISEQAAAGATRSDNASAPRPIGSAPRRRLCNVETSRRAAAPSRRGKRRLRKRCLN
jgi:hypothetical protein